MTDDTRAVLQLAVQKGLRVHAISVAREARHEGHLLAVDDEELQLQLEPDHDLAVHDSVTVTFSAGPRTYTCLTRVVDLDGGQVWVAAPEELLSVDRRLRPRSPISVPVQVGVEGHAGEYVLVDLSVIGMRLRPLQPVLLTVGSEVDVTLDWQGHHVEARAELRHTKSGYLGMFFSDSVRRGRVVPIPGLADLLDAATSP